MQEEFQSYGIDWDGPQRDDRDDIVTIPDTPCPCTPDVFHQMCAHIDPLRESSDYGIDIFTDAMSFLEASYL